MSLQPIRTIDPDHQADAISVVLVEDHGAIRLGLELLLRRHGHLVVGATDSPARAMHLVTARRPDVVLIDIGLGPESGTALARSLLSELPGLGVLFYTGSRRPETLAEALACGARGLALKSGALDELLKAIEAVARGGTWLDPRLPRLLKQSTDDDVTQRLSAREREVLLLLADGMTGEAIARHLFLSAETIRTHVRNAMRKLGARTRSHAIAMIVRSQHRPKFVVAAESPATDAVTARLSGHRPRADAPLATVGASMGGSEQVHRFTDSR